ncbi:alpha/beta hydrolase [Alteromonas gracilis]|uniref:alpha/beta hydrolase n=1 Tax=Alteromonas gracilis TaxID=1479524 RepID=UPI003218EFEE
MRLIKVAIATFCFFQSAVFAAADTTVIFEVGFGTKANIWDPVIALLPDNVKVINETRGSLMTPDAEPTTLAQDVAAMQKRIKQAKQNGSVIVVGHSYGGLVATQTLKTSLSEIDGMVLIEPTTLVHRLRFKALDKERVIADDKVIATYMPTHLQSQYQLLTDTLDQVQEALIPLPSNASDYSFYFNTNI